MEDDIPVLIEYNIKTSIIVSVLWKCMSSSRDRWIDDVAWRLVLTS